MKRLVTKKFLASFIIFLIVTLPVAFASTTLTITSYAGKDSVEGFMRETDDSLTVETEVVPDTEEDSFANFSASNIYIEIFGKEDGFDECEEEDGTYYCTYTSSEADRTASEKTFVVSVIDDEGITADSETDTFYIDGEAPSIIELDYPTYFTGDINISLEVEDTACSGCGSGTCSGIDRIEIGLNNTVRQNLSISSISTEENEESGEGQGDCDYEGTIETSLTELDATEGKQQLCVYVYDKVQNSNKKCGTVIVDSIAPSISSSSFVIKDDSGNAIEHISEEAISTTVQVNITETGSGLNINSIYANLSALNAEIGDDYNGMPGDCEEYENGVFVCSWDIYLQLSGENQATVKIYAEDNAANSQTLTKTISFVEDTTAPVILSLESAFSGYLNLKNNTLILEIQEEASGFDDTKVYLDMSEAMLGQKQADYCSQSGTLWYCYWENFAIPSAVPHGEAIDFKPGTVTDDAGNDYDSATSLTEETFVFDEKAPEFINVTIGALGREAAVITEGDVVYILTYITDDVSGIDAANVYADFSDFEESNELEQAQSCSETSTDIWECYWEYTGALEAGTSIELNMIATDNAGNKKDSDDDNIIAEIEVVGIAEEVVDYWQAEAAVEEMPMLNPNFLYFTSTGTIVRLDTELQPNGAIPFIHTYQINSCQASLKMADNLTAALSWYDAAILGQYYYDTENKADKYLLVNIPAFFYGKANITVLEGSIVNILCTADVTQARTEYSDIYSPNEAVNLTATVPLMAGLYTEPSLATVDKIQKAEKLMKILDKLTKWLGWWSEWGTKICSPINGVRIVANNVVTMLKAIDVLSVFTATEAIAGAVEITNFLDGIWYGARNEEEYESTGREIQETEIPDSKVTEKSFNADPSKPFQNKYRIPSFGYLCDTVLCESCSESWNKLMFKNAELPQGMYIGGEYVPNLLGTRFTVPLNPRENIVVALVCSPPCIPGIYAQLNVYNEILIAYNTCLNIAAAKGEDLVECEEFLQAQICQNVVNAFFWHWFWGLRKVAIANVVSIVFDAAAKEIAACPVNLKDTVSPSSSCSLWRGAVALFTLGSTLVDTYNTVNNLFNFNWNLTGNKTAEEQQDEQQTDLEKEIGAQLGTTPAYG